MSSPIARKWQPIKEEITLTAPSEVLVSNRSRALLEALTWQERCELLRNKCDCLGESQLANPRFERWESQLPYSSGQFSLRDRLAAEGVTENEFKAGLNLSTEQLCPTDFVLPDWVHRIERALAASRCAESSMTLPGLPDDDRRIALLNLVRPLISHEYDRFKAGIAGLKEQFANLPFDPDSVADSWFRECYPRLTGMLCRTIVLELQVAGLEGRLIGDTPEQRFQDFSQQLRDPEVVRRILHEYPVLAREVDQQLQQTVDFGLEFLQRLCCDFSRIREEFCVGEDPGCLVSFGGETGDSHQQGRHVVIAEFSAGLKLVYKPRSLAVDAHFQSLLDWFNKRGEHPQLRTVHSLDRGDYGWMEFVSAESCKSKDQVVRFYQRQGAYLAILYLLQATDFHSENLIAAGEHPVLIDLESLLQPQSHRLEDVSPLDRKLFRATNDSVLRSALLPQRSYSSRDVDGVDISGLGTPEGQLTPYKVAFLDDVGKDTMRLTRGRLTMQGHQNQPKLAGDRVDLVAHLEAMIEGFQSGYQTILRHRDELLADNSPLNAFAPDKVRAIFRHTRTYSMLLQESFHPDVLRNALDRDLLFDRLWIEASERPEIAAIATAEQDDLQKGDIPVFHTRPGSRHLWTSRGRKIANYFSTTSLETATTCLQKMGEPDMERQTWFLRASFATIPDLSGTSAVAKQAERVDRPFPDAATTRTASLDAAGAIAERLERLAICEQGETNWMGLANGLRDRSHRWIVPLGWDLYDGLPGVILFLARYGVVSGQQRFTRLAESGLKTLLRYWQTSLSHAAPASISVFGGPGGLVYTFAQLGALWNRRDLTDTAQAVATQLAPLVAKDEDCDIISGSAGFLTCLLALHHLDGRDQTLNIARRCADRLLETAFRTSVGLAWQIKDVTEIPLAGFSHGAAGIAYSLLQVAEATGETRFRETAVQAMRYERHLFSAEHANWPDLRSESGLRNSGQANLEYTVAWCHGAAGIGLGRIGSWESLSDPETRSEIEVAIDTTIRHGFGSNHSLCHGDLGNLELLLVASQVLQDSQLACHVNEITLSILDDIQRQGWKCGVPLRVETPGLMTGLAGIGYQLLRLASPETVPSVLLLESPKRA